MVKFIFIKDPVPCLTNRFSMYFFLSFRNFGKDNNTVKMLMF